MPRADLINQVFRPDLSVCIHLNAAPWKDQNQTELLDRNDYHVLVNGCYMGGELAYDNQRFEMLFRLLSGWDELEREYAECLSRSLARSTGLPAFVYKGPNAIKIGPVEGFGRETFLPTGFTEVPWFFWNRISPTPSKRTKGFAWAITRASLRWMGRCDYL